MNTEPENLRATVERHNREIAQLRAELRAVKDGQTKKELQAALNTRVAELEATIKLEELQEQMAEEERAKHKKRGPFGLW